MAVSLQVIIQIQPYGPRRSSMRADRHAPAANGRKDLGYALQLAETVGLELRGARTADGLLAAAIEGGLSEMYRPVIYQVIAESNVRAPA